MSTTANDSEPTAARRKAANGTVDKYAEARLAKKKARRRAHRHKIKRSNTNG
ncbi:MAG TPA: hypothetical protein VFR08_12120 [Candidatus Angelobacter sp.]|nr:hypothetical protein [Candidatus Angelobacter sp.]